MRLQTTIGMVVLLLHSLMELVGSLWQQYNPLHHQTTTQWWRPCPPDAPCQRRTSSLSDSGAVLSCYGWTYLVGGIFWWSVHCLVAFVVAVVVIERGGIADAGMLSWHSKGLRTW